MSTSTQTLTAAARAVEPTGNLDSRSGTEVLGFLHRAVDQLGQS